MLAVVLIGITYVVNLFRIDVRDKKHLRLLSYMSAWQGGNASVAPASETDAVVRLWYDMSPLLAFTYASHGTLKLTQCTSSESDAGSRHIHAPLALAGHTHTHECI
jgi:hypothetical protein